MVIAKDRVEDAYARGVAVAWMTASLQRAKKIPPLPTILRQQRGKVQTVSEQRSMLEILSQQYGGSLRSHRRARRSRRGGAR